MENLHKSSSHVQMQAEYILFRKLEDILSTKLEKKKLYLADNALFEKIKEKKFRKIIVV